MKTSNRCLWLSTFLLLSACTEMVGSVACLSGMCESKERRLSEILWDPPLTLQKGGCFSIEGHYHDEGELILGSLPGKEKDAYFRRASRLSNYLLSSENYPVKVEYRSYMAIPSTISEVPKKDVTGRLLGGTVQVADDSNFYKNAILSIKNSQNILEITLSDGNGKKYNAFLIPTESPQIGCSGDSLIIRVTKAVAGSEGGLGLARATQLKLKKLSDNRLQLNIQNRNWAYSISQGLVGTDTNGNTSGTEPRKSEVTLTFSTAQP